MKKRYLVFVSSTYRDLKQERQAVVRTLSGLNCIPAGMELFPAIDVDQWEYIKSAIDESDYFVLVVGGRYGTLAADGDSYTEKEFDYAVATGKRVIALLRKDVDVLSAPLKEENAEIMEKLKQFRAKVSNGRLVRFWAQSSEIPEQLSGSLLQTIEQYPSSGWIRDPGPYAVNETEAQSELLKLANADHVCSVDILGHSNTTRAEWIRRIVVDKAKKVRVAIQHPDLIQNPAQLPRVKEAVRASLASLSDSGRYEVRFHRDYASLRLAILRGTDHQAVAAIAGWYLYRETNRVVPGARNPSVLALDPENILVAWADREFQTKWTSGERVSLETHGEFLCS